MRKNFILICLLFIFSSFNVIAQNVTTTISGVVVDSKSIPMVGVSILEKGTKNATTTNNDGAFKLKIASGGTIVVTYIGFETKELKVTNQDNLKIKLKESPGALDEVVVVGYGSQKKINLTGSVSSVDFKDLENTPQSSTLNILSGRVPGLSVVQQSGQPGDDNSEVSLRGPINTSLSDSSPLVIIDGVQSTLKDLSNLSPQQISNISVLKDASATAIYGARGGNGVILVSTKVPQAGKMRISFDSYYGIQKGTYLPDFVESWQWMTLHNEATGTLLFPLDKIEDVKNNKLTDTFANNNPINRVFRNAPMSNYNLGISGGSNTLKFQGSIGYLDQEGIMNNTNSNRVNYRANILATISPILEAGVNISGYFQNVHQAYYNPSQVLVQLYRTYPITPEKYSNGLPGVYNLYDGTVLAPADLYMNIGRDDYNNQKSNYLAYLQLKPLKGLVLKSNISYGKQQDVRNYFLPTYSYGDPTGRPAFVNLVNTLYEGSAITNQFQISNTATYNFLITKKGIATALLGQEYANYKADNFSVRGSNLPNDEQQQLSRATTNFVPAGNSTAWRLQSFFGRFNYNYDQKYLFEANFRTDGSSRFPVNKRYSYFPSASIAWVLSNEAFFKKIMGDKSPIDLLKFRASYGKSGNDRIGNYSYQQTLNLDNYYHIGGTLLPGAAQINYANPDIEWETTTSKNLALDLNMFKNKLSITAEIFDRTTDGLLYTLPLPPSFGTTRPAVQNIASVKNKGYELVAQYRNSIGKFTYNIGANLAYVKNKIIDLKSVTAISGANILREGDDINSFFGYKSDGLFRNADDVANYPRYPTGFVLGSLRYIDTDNNGKIDDRDRTILGTGSTPYTFGVNGSLGFKGFDLSFLFQGVKGKSVYIADWANRPGNARVTEFWQEWFDNRFQATANPNGTWPALTRGTPNLVSDFYVRDASYIRLKNIELGYKLPAMFLEKMKIANIRFYMSAQNVLTITGLIHQVDPERAARQSGNSYFPQVSVFTAGFNASF